MFKKTTAAVVILSSLLGLSQLATAVTYSFQAIDVPGALETHALGLNDLGQVVGFYRDASGIRRGFLFDSGTISPINPPGASGTIANDINNTGEIVGRYWTMTNSGHGFSYVNNGYQTIDVNGNDTQILGINDLGQMVGIYNTHGFLAANGIQSTVDFPGSQATQAYSINNNGDIVGRYGAISTEHGFLLSDGTFTTIDYPTAYWCSAYDINNIGQLVGSFADQTGRHGFILQGGIYSIFDYPSESFTNYWDNYLIPYGNNDRGQITGIYVDGQGVHGFIATPEPQPVPEPASLLLVGCGLVGLVLFRRATL